MSAMSKKRYTICDISLVSGTHGIEMTFDKLIHYSWLIMLSGGLQFGCMEVYEEKTQT